MTGSKQLNFSEYCRNHLNTKHLLALFTFTMLSFMFRKRMYNKCRYMYHAFFPTAYFAELGQRMEGCCCFTEYLLTRL